MTHTPFPAATIVGYPRVGRFRELKKAQEAFWKAKSRRMNCARRPQMCSAPTMTV